MQWIISFVHQEGAPETMNQGSWLAAHNLDQTLENNPGFLFPGRLIAHPNKIFGHLKIVFLILFSPFQLKIRIYCVEWPEENLFEFLG